MKIALDTGLTVTGNAAGLVGPKPIEAVVAGLINVVLGMAGIILVALLVYGGMTSAGDKTKVETATKIIKNAVIGLIITVAAYAIASYVVGALVSVAG